jgi:parallel beta-helix repeat protein
MKRLYSLFIIIFLIKLTSLYSQTEIPLTNNMTVGSNSSVKIIPGTYKFWDYEEDGVIQIVGKENVTVDGSDVTVDGEKLVGYMIYIKDSKNIEIKNFKSVKNYFYALYADNCENIRINNCNFSNNKIDSSGWISIWTDYGQALGGGVLMNKCTGSIVDSNIMKNQNDGVALYHCTNITVSNNNFEWNTSYGIRMYFTDSCYIHDNVANNINRPYTDPSDCAAILMIVSNNNHVEHNDFRYSGDGVFLGQYQYSDIKNNNYFAFNDCSGSPHNAIEATFADGNVFKHNICNYSQYGFWLGYSFNTLVDSNEINNNQVGGISIEWAYDNTFTNNIINGNPIGVQLFERGNVSSDYPNNFSHNYTIENNLFEENTRAITSDHTEHIIVKNNQFLKNWNDIDFVTDSVSSNDTIINNTFVSPVIYFIENNSKKTIYAPDNSFTPDDSILINCKMYGKNYYSELGDIIWEPRQPGQLVSPDSSIPVELTEPPYDWSVYTEECGWHGLSIPTTVEYDSLDKKVGKASLKITTGNGWYVWVSYRPEEGKMPVWDLSQNQSLSFWVKGLDTNNGGFQFTRIRLGNTCGGYYNYTADASQILNTRMADWKLYEIPLKGSPTWKRTGEGNSDVSLSDINYIELYADTYGVGFTIWFDGLTFGTPYPVKENNQESGFSPEAYPNPAGQSAIIRYNISKPQFVLLKIIDIFGNDVFTLVNEKEEPGNYEIPFKTNGMSNSIYFFKFITGSSIEFGKIVVLK